MSLRSLPDSPREFDENLNIHSILNHVIQLARAGFAKKLKINEVYDPPYHHGAIVSLFKSFKPRKKCCRSL